MIWTNQDDPPGMLINQQWENLDLQDMWLEFLPEFFWFHPDVWGEDPIWRLARSFQMGGENHQLEKLAQRVWGDFQEIDICWDGGWCFFLGVWVARSTKEMFLNFYCLRDRFPKKKLTLFSTFQAFVFGNFRSEFTSFRYLSLVFACRVISKRGERFCCTSIDSFMILFQSHIHQLVFGIWRFSTSRSSNAQWKKAWLFRLYRGCTTQIYHIWGL